MDKPDGKYVYCVLKGRVKRNFGRIGLGKQKSKVYTIPYKNVSAVVSDVSVQEFSPSLVKLNLVRAREFDSDWLENVLFAHRNVVKSFFRRHTVIPVPYFTVPKGEDEVKKLLSRNYERLKRDMEKFQDMHEMRIRVIFDRESLEDSIKEELSTSNKEFVELESISRKTSGGKSMLLRSMIRTDVKIEARKRLKSWVLMNTPKIQKSLKELSHGSKVNKLLDGKNMVSMNFLVKKKEAPTFNRAFQKIQREFESRHVKLELKGPFPVYNFASQRGFAS